MIITPKPVHTVTGTAKDGTTFTRVSLDRRVARHQCAALIWEHNQDQINKAIAAEVAAL